MKLTADWMVVKFPPPAGCAGVTVSTIGLLAAMHGPVGAPARAIAPEDADTARRQASGRPPIMRSPHIALTDATAAAPGAFTCPRSSVPPDVPSVWLWMFRIDRASAPA